MPQVHSPLLRHSSFRHSSFSSDPGRNGLGSLDDLLDGRRAIGPGGTACRARPAGPACRALTIEWPGSSRSRSSAPWAPDPGAAGASASTRSPVMSGRRMSAIITSYFARPRSRIMTGPRRRRAPSRPHSRSDPAGRGLRRGRFRRRRPPEPPTREARPFFGLHRRRQGLAGAIFRPTFWITCLMSRALRRMRCSRSTTSGSWPMYRSMTFTASFRISSTGRATALWMASTLSAAVVAFRPPAVPAY